MAYIDSLYDNYFLEYASYYIKERAIPHVDDGLKPVQRRIMHSLNKIADGKFHGVTQPTTPTGTLMVCMRRLLAAVGIVSP